MAVRVSPQHEHAERHARDLDLVALLDQARRLGHVHLCLEGRPEPRRDEVVRHAEGPEVLGRLRLVASRSERALGRCGVLGALHDLLGAGECDERRARADVVGMEVRDHDAAHLRLPELLERVAPRTLRLRRSEAAVDQRPALRILDRVAVDVIERPRQRVGDAVDAPTQIRDRQGARRPNSTKAACVTGMCSEKNTSTASANRRISSWAVSAFRRLRKFMSERALSVQWNCV